ncbi:hypothetical protein GCM10027567_09680 [Spongiibacter taiwanensis]|uniref:type II toxin-antitoxin system BrnA family antitoxin n=1 Tax=Spongiibacter taiwanensis TaxID=1748242 RepID=UPI0032DF2105
MMNSDFFDRKFNDNEADVLDELDLSTAVHPNRRSTEVVLALPAAMVERLDIEAERLGVTRENLIKQWLAERLGSTSGHSRGY